MDVKDLIKERRLKLGYSMRYVAEQIGVNVATISRWESGDIENMRRDKIVLLAKVLRISPSVIMGWEDLPPDPDTVVLSEEERDVVLAYRALPSERKEVVRLILGLQERPSNTPK